MDLETEPVPTPARTPGRGARAQWIAAGLLVTGFGLLSISWVFANPPGAAPDEPAALVKALASGYFEFSGPTYTAPLPPYDGKGTRRFIAKASQSYSLPANQIPAGLEVCMAFKPNNTAACVAATPHTTSTAHVETPTPMGTYPPFLDLPMGLAARFATSTDRAYYLARLAAAAVSVVALAGAVLTTILRRRSPWPVVGIALAVTPMTVFLASTVSTNGIEIAAAVCFWAALLRLRFSDAPRMTWWALGVGGTVMTLSRQLDVGWLVAGLALFVIMLGPRMAWRRFRDGGRLSLIVAGILAFSALISVVWDLAVMPSTGPTLAIASANLPTARGVAALFRQAIGDFGWVDTPISGSVELAWLWIVAVLMAVALVLGTWRHRVALLAAAGAVAAATVATQTFVVAPTGFGMQSRYVLAFAVLLPLLAAEIIAERAPMASLGVAGLAILPAVMIFVAWAQWSSFFTNVRRYGVGLYSSRSVLTDARWQPPGGTLLWLILAGIAVLLMLGSSGAFLAGLRPAAADAGVASPAASPRRGRTD